MDLKPVAAGGAGLAPVDTGKPAAKPGNSPAVILSENLLQPYATGTGRVPAGVLQLLQALQAFPGASPADQRGLALYQSIEMAGLAAALRPGQQMQDELLRQFFAQQPAQNESEEYDPRWLLELPVNFQNRLRALTIRLYSRRKPARRAVVPDSWAALFSLELARCGTLELCLIVTGAAVSVSVACAQPLTASLLEQQQRLLGDKLAACDLRLTDWQSTSRAPESFNRNLPPQEAPLAGPVELTDFRMHNNAHPVPPGTRIPDALYRAMASVLGYLLEIEDHYPA